MTSEKGLVSDEAIQEMTEIAVDRMKTSAEPIPVIVVGGGSILVTQPVSGASEMIKPDHFAVANAIGAAIAQVGGETDRVFSLDKMTRDDALAEAAWESVVQSSSLAGGKSSIVDANERLDEELRASGFSERLKGDMELYYFESGPKPVPTAVPEESSEDEGLYDDFMSDEQG